jgi:hypothetical protein
VTSWGILHQAPIHYQTYYAYKFTNTSQPVQQIDAELDPDLCLLDTLQPGDELLRPVQLNTAQQGAGQVNLRVDFNTISPLIWRPVAYNPFGISFEIGGLAPTPIHILLANNGADHITIPLV